MKNILIVILMLGLFGVSSYAGPVASNYRFDGRTPVFGDPISTRPLVKVQVLGTNVSFNAFILEIDNVQVTTINPCNFTYDGTDFSFQVAGRLSAGVSHNFKLKATDDTGAMIPYTFSGYVASEEQEILESPLAIPNPATYNMRITYKLTNAVDLDINIYNLNGELVWQQELSSGQIGAQAGYNEIVWNLRSGFGEYCPNGPYVCVLIKEVDGRKVVMEKLKLFVLR